MIHVSSWRGERARYVMLAATLFGGAAPVRAQTDPPRCAEAARNVEVGPLRQADVDALALNCPASGNAGIAKAWTASIVRSREELNLLVQRSGPDLRVYQAVIGVVAGKDRPTEARLAALQSLLSMHEPGRIATRAWMVAARVGDELPYSAHGGGPSHAPAAHATEVPALLAQLSWEDPDSVVRHAATVLRQSLEFTDPGTAPVRPGTITLSPGCRGLVTLRNAENITLPLRIESVSGADEIWLRPKPWVEGQPNVGYPWNPPAGPVVVKYGGREVARLNQRPATPCPPK